MGYKIIKAKQNLDLANRSVKKGDQIEIDEKEADDLIKRGLADEGSMQSDADQRRPEDLTKDQNAPGETVRPLTTASLPGAPENKMQPDSHSNK